MNQRRVTILLVVAVVVLAAAFWVGSRPAGNPSTEAGALVLPELKSKINDITEIRISKADGTKTTLRKEPSAWRVVEREYPADSGRVRKLLLDLAALSVVEPKTSNPKNYAQLGVEDLKEPKATGTLLELDGPVKPNALIVGKTSGTRSSYVRVSGEKQSLLVSPQLNVDATPRRWLDRNIVDVDREKVREVALKLASGPDYTVSRENKEQTDFTVNGVPKGRKLTSATAGNPIAGALADLTLDDVRRAASSDAKSDEAGKKAKKEDKPDVAVFRTFDGLEVEVTGRREGDRRYIAVAAKSTQEDSAEEARKLNARLQGWEFEIPTYKYDAIFKPLEDLLEPKD